MGTGSRFLLAIVTLSLCAGLSPMFTAYPLTQGDYTQLEQYLYWGRWQKADQETHRVMLEVAGQDPDDSLDRGSLQDFPCADLQAIDLLWYRYSLGRFGFRIQKQMFVDSGHPLDVRNYNFGINYRAFGEQVGWYKYGKWLLYASKMNYSILAPQGHLPWMWNLDRCLNCGTDRQVLFQRVEACQI